MIMKDEHKAELDGLFAKAREEKQVAKKKRDIEAEEQAAFVEKFLSAREKVIVPAYKEFADYLNGHGWTGEIELSEEKDRELDGRGGVRSGPIAPAARLTFYQGDKRPSVYHRHELPHFSMTCAKSARKVSIHHCTIGPNHGGSSGSAGSLSLEDIAPDTVEKQLVEFFKKLMANVPSVPR